MYGCRVESHASTRQRPEPLQSQIHEDRIAGNGVTSLTHYNLLHKFIQEPQAMKIPDAKAAVDKEWKNSRQSQYGIWRKSRARRSLFWKHKETKRRASLPHWWMYVTSKMRSWNQNYRSTKAESCSGEDIVEYDFGAYAFYWTGLVCVPGDCRNNHGCHWQI